MSEHVGGGGLDANALAKKIGQIIEERVTARTAAIRKERDEALHEIERQAGAIRDLKTMISAMDRVISTAKEMVTVLETNAMPDTQARWNAQGRLTRALAEIERLNGELRTLKFGEEPNLKIGDLISVSLNPNVPTNEVRVVNEKGVTVGRMTVKAG